MTSKEAAPCITGWWGNCGESPAEKDVAVMWLSTCPIMLCASSCSWADDSPARTAS